MGGDGLCDVAQGGVSGGMALNVVDRLEVVDVDEGDGELLLGALDELQFEQRA